MPNKRNLYIIGAGGLGRELENWLEMVPKSDRDWEIKGYLHSGNHELDNYPTDYSVVGDWQNFQFASEDLCIIGVEDHQWKQKIYEFLNTKIEFLTFVHPSVVINKFTKLGEGSVICPSAVISTNVTLGKCVTVNTGTQIGHDVEIGDFTSIMANVDIGGNTLVGNRVFIGSNATIIPKRKIASRVRIGAGSIVVNHINKAATIFGNPARKLV